MFQRGTDRCEFIRFQLAHLLGKELRLPFARDLRADGTGAPHLFEYRVVEWYVQQLRIAQQGETFRQFEHIDGLASQLAAAGTVPLMFLFVVVH